MGAAAHLIFRRSMRLLLSSVFVLSLVALVASTFVRARGTRALQVCVNNLRVLAAAKEQWALEHSRAANDMPTWDDVRPYLRKAEIPLCPDGGAYTLRRASEAPSCSMGGPDHSLNYDSAKERRFSAVAGLLALLSGLGLLVVLLLPEKVQNQDTGGA